MVHTNEEVVAYERWKAPQDSRQGRSYKQDGKAVLRRIGLGVRRWGRSGQLDALSQRICNGRRTPVRRPLPFSDAFISHVPYVIELTASANWLTEVTFLMVGRVPSGHLDMPFGPRYKFVECKQFGLVQVSSKQFETAKFVLKRPAALANYFLETTDYYEGPRPEDECAIAEQFSVRPLVADVIA